MGFHRQWLLVFAGLLATATAVPQSANGGNIYNIELIIFRAPGAGVVGGAGADDGASGGSAIGRFVRSTPAAELKLGDIANRLRAASGYTPIAHFGWSQTASDWGTRAGFTLQRLGANVPGLNGRISLERGQYLHLGVKVSYGGGAIDERRRIRFYEKNYYDSPSLGVIAIVTPASSGRDNGR
ncbi:MAG: hypothetical protein R3E77_07400 [Steroidobacteraceae bacterium]